jgi:ribosomal protein S27E
MRNKDKEKIIEIEPFEIKSSSKKQSKEYKPIKNPLQSISLEYENNDILNFNLYVDFTKFVQYIEEVGNLEPVYCNSDIIEFKEVENGKGSYKAIDYNKKSFFLTLSATCPKCQHNELLLEDYEGIHSTLLDLEDNIGDEFQFRDEGTAVISKFIVKAKIGNEYDDFFDIGVKCLGCSHELFLDLFEDTYGEICNKIEQFKVNP